MTIPYSYPFAESTGMCPMMCTTYATYPPPPSFNCGCPLGVYCPTLSALSPAPLTLAGSATNSRPHHLVGRIHSSYPHSHTAPSTHHVSSAFYLHNKLMTTISGPTSNGPMPTLNMTTHHSLHSGPMSSGTPSNTLYFPVAPSSPTLSGASSTSTSMCSTSPGSRKHFFFTPGKWKQS